MADKGLMTQMQFTDSEGNAYRGPAGLWLAELMLSLPPEWRDEICTIVAEKWEMMKSNHIRSQIARI